MYIADFHLHSKYSRATSKNMDIDELALWAGYKGIDLLGTGDFTHFLWIHALREKLNETDRQGIYSCGGTDFIITGEVCNIFDRGGKSRRIHNLIFLSSIESAERFNRIMGRYTDLNIDGRPILMMEAKDLVQVVKDVDEFGFVVPAHIWTPHFSLFGSNSGFDDIEECFGEFSDDIFAIETGLSSDPAMNWMLSRLDGFSLISNSDAHSPHKLGREANVFDRKFDFPALVDILKRKDTVRFLCTLEYFPEEGKYHFDGHRNCKISLSPEETKSNKTLCPACGKKVTVGVLSRVRELADRSYGVRPERFVPFKKIVPLCQIIGNVLDKPADSISVRNHYLEIIKRAGPEFRILTDFPEADMRGRLDENIIRAVLMVRQGNVHIEPGYDGEFGKVEIQFEDSECENEQTLF